MRPALPLDDIGPDVSIAGDPTYGLDFARHLVAEVACNPLSAGARVECIGVGIELAALNPAVRTLDNATAVGVDVVTARATQAGPEAWTTRLILLDASMSHPPWTTCSTLFTPTPDARAPTSS